MMYLLGTYQNKVVNKAPLEKCVYLFEDVFISKQHHPCISVAHANNQKKVS